MKIQKKIILGGVNGPGGGGVGGVGLGGLRVDVIEELRFLGKFTKKKIFFFGAGVGSGGGGGGLGWCGGSQGGCE